MQTASSVFFAVISLFFNIAFLLRNTAVKLLSTNFAQTKIKYFAILLTAAIFLTTPASVAADFLKVVAPENIYPETAFEINLEISALPSTDYNIKARLGNQTNSLRDGQTFSEAAGVWLSDSVNWTSFPKFTTDQNGRWAGKIKTQASKNATLGQNYLVVRIRSAEGKSTDSPTYSITINSAPKENPSPPPPSPQVIQTGEPVLNEFIPQPETGAKEWVEIKNKGTVVADLSGWKIDDKDGGSTPAVLPTGTKVAPNGFLVITFDQPKLNDLSDSVRLLKPDNSVVESYSYNQTSRGQSWSKDNNGTWFLTAVVTPNAENYTAQAASTLNTNSNPKNINSSNPQTPTNSEVVKTPANKLPQVLATSEAKTATVSANFSNKKTPLSSIPFLILGSLFVVGSGLFLVKQRMKSGQSEISDQPL